MIGLFRKMRRKLANDNQFLRYSRYALGEIVLVVIGILIALQANNWNEQNKARAYEKLLLSELLASIENDKEHFEFLYDRMETKIKALNNFLEALHTQDSFNDIIMLTDYFDMRKGIQVAVDLGPYESLKSKGLELIQDVKLRKHLVSLYETDYPRLENFVNNYYELNYQRSKDLRQKFEEVYLIKENDSVWDTRIRLDYKNLVSNPHFRNYINVEIDEYQNNINRLNWISNITNLEIAHIKRVLGEEFENEFVEKEK